MDPTKITYVLGDATKPAGVGVRLIPHVVNDCGKWGRGFVLALSKVDIRPERCYRAWSQNQSSSALEESGNFALGEIQIVPFDKAEKQIYIVNMVGQHDIKDIGAVPPIRYDSLRSCMKKVAASALSMSASIHTCMFGSGLAGGDWGQIAKMIEEEWCSKGIAVTVYKF
jgi:O-acetyl-ADP-ribose deacetylase (regulator of RNase III)